MATSRDDIISELKLTGAEEVVRALNDVAAAGSRAFSSMSTAVGRATGRFPAFGSAIDAVRNKAAQLEAPIADVRQSFNNLGNSVRNVARNVSIIGGAIGGAVLAFGALVKNSADAADHIATTAEAIGISAKNLQELTFAAKQSNVSQETFTGSMTRLNRAMGDQVKKSEADKVELAKLNHEFARGKLSADDYFQKMNDFNTKFDDDNSVFKRLGIDVKAGNGDLKDGKDILLEIADAFSDMPNGAQKSAFALELFGRAGARMISFLNEGRSGIEKLVKEGQRIAPALAPAEIKIGQDMGDAFDKLSDAVTASRNKFLLLFAAPIKQFFDEATEVVVKNRDAFLSLGRVLSTQVAAVLRDVIAVMEGRDLDVQNSWVIKTRDAFVGMGEAARKAIVDIIIPAANALLAVADTVAQALNGIFGTDVTGGQLIMVGVILKLVGAFGLLRVALTTVFTLLRVFTVAVGGPTAAIIALGLVIGAFIGNQVQQLGGLGAIWNRVWGTIVAFVESVFARLLSGARNIGSFFAGLWTGAQTAAQTFFAWLGSGAQTVWDFIVGIWRGGIDRVTALWTSLTEGVSAVFTFIGEMFASFWNGVVALWQAGVGALVNAWNGLVEFIQPVLDGIKSAFQAVGDFLKDMWDRTIGWMLTKVQEFAAKVIELWNAIRRRAPSPGAGSGGGSAQPAFATGGLFRGRPGKDTNLAWLSDMEFIMNPRAVQKYGAGFMHMINSLRFPLDRLAGFADGGLVNLGLSPRPAMSGTGGAIPARATSHRPFTLQIGGEVFEGLTASDGAVDSLQRYAVSRSLKSAGRKPGWYHGR